MIKFEIAEDTIKDVMRRHLKSLKSEVKENITTHKQIYQNDKNYIDLLMYIEGKLDKILCGQLRELKEIIEYIEKNYYISTNKLSKIKEIKQKEITGDKTVYLENYIKEKNLELHLLKNDKTYKYIKDFKEAIGDLKRLWESYGDRLGEIFDYDEFIKHKGDWKAYDLVERLNISICPYCNRQYINTLIKDEKRARAVLDHFYAKSLYPYLALSLYNLIPCCHFCNSTFKGDKDFYNNEPIYPYEEGFSNDAKFETDFENQKLYDYKYLLGLSDNFKINIKVYSKDTDKIKKINRSNQVFYLEDMYSFHKDYVRELIRSIIINNKSRIDEIYKTYQGAFKSRKEVVQMMFLNFREESDLGKRALSKLTKDIFEEFSDMNEE
ncbi:hypothetical protein [Priestia megaterium]|uniref:hypothetical protein n=1 Tax=Priestia megaterium TaxID=1404 RepID=UPI0018680D85|nr:hypothetical protein [Priestia megaterium]MBE2975811.1 hypothetical protein [Priestia megaterium]